MKKFNFMYFKTKEDMENDASTISSELLEELTFDPSQSVLIVKKELKKHFGVNLNTIDIMGETHLGKKICNTTELWRIDTMELIFKTSNYWEIECCLMSGGINEY
jgi:hypothetical protein